MKTNVLRPLAFAALAALSGCTTTGNIKPDGAAPVNVTLVYGSNRYGVTEPCGCHSHPYGGLDREANAVAELRRRDAALFYVDAGNLFSKPEGGNPKTGRRKAEFLVSALNRMGLQVFAPGAGDYRLGVDFLKRMAGVAHFGFVSTNVIGDDGATVFAPYRIEVRDGVRFGVISLTDPKLQVKGLRAETADATLAKWLPVVAAKSDLVVLLSQLGSAEDERIARHYPQINLIVGGDPTLAAGDAYWFAGHTLVVDPHNNGYLLGKLDLQIQLPFKGFFSPKVVAENQARLAEYESRLKASPGNAIVSKAIERLRREESLAAIPGGSIYRNELVQLDEEHYGTRNDLTVMLNQEKERVHRQAIQEAE